METDAGQLPTSEIERQYKELWEYKPDIVQPFTGDLGEAENQLDIHSIIPSITRKYTESHARKEILLPDQTASRKTT
jgi:hypothetical protein